MRPGPQFIPEYSGGRPPTQGLRAAFKLFSHVTATAIILLHDAQGSRSWTANPITKYKRSQAKLTKNAPAALQFLD